MIPTRTALFSLAALGFVLSSAACDVESSGDRAPSPGVSPRASHDYSAWNVCENRHSVNDRDFRRTPLLQETIEYTLDVKGDGDPEFAHDCWIDDGCVSCCPTDHSDWCVSCCLDDFSCMEWVVVAE